MRYILSRSHGNNYVQFIILLVHVRYLTQFTTRYREFVRTRGIFFPDFVRMKL